MSSLGPLNQWFGSAYLISGLKPGRNQKGSMMKRFIVSAASVLIALAAIAPAKAASSVSFGTGFNVGHVQTATGAASTGTAAAGSIATGTNTSLGAGIATVTPAGSLSSAVGASAGQSNAASGALSIGNGAAASGALSNNAGIGVGVGFTNTMP
jgi:hypothetical protein